MREWLVDLVGEEMAPFASWLLAAAIVVLLIFLVIAIAKKALGGAGGLRAKGRGPRLAVMDVAAIDQKRKLVLVRRDEVEHLLLIGGQNDLVVEPHILRVPASARGSRPEPTLRPEPEASLAPDRQQTVISPPPVPMPAPVPAATRAAPARLQPSAAQRPLDARVAAASPLTRPLPRAPVSEAAPEPAPRTDPVVAAEPRKADKDAAPVSAPPAAFPSAPPVVASPVVAPPIVGAADAPVAQAPTVRLDPPTRETSARETSERREPSMERKTDAAPPVELGDVAGTAPKSDRNDPSPSGPSESDKEIPVAEMMGSAARAEPVVEEPAPREPAPREPAPRGTRIDPVIGDMPEAPTPADRPAAQAAMPSGGLAATMSPPVGPQRQAPEVGVDAEPSRTPPPTVPTPLASRSDWSAGAGGEDVAPETIQRRPLTGTARTPIDAAPAQTPVPVQRRELPPLGRSPSVSTSSGTGQSPLTRTPIGEGQAPVRRPLTSPPAPPASNPAASGSAPPAPPAVPSYTVSSGMSLPPARTPVSGPAMATGDVPSERKDRSEAPRDPVGGSPVIRQGSTTPPVQTPQVPIQPPQPSPTAPSFTSLGTSGATSGVIAAAERQREALRSRPTTGINPADRVGPTTTTPPLSQAPSLPPAASLLVPDAVPTRESNGEEPTDKRPLSVKSFATTIQSMKPSYEPPAVATPPLASPAALAAPAAQPEPPASRLSVPPFVSRVVDDRQDVSPPVSKPAPTPALTQKPVGSAPMAAAGAPAAGYVGPDSDGSLEDFLTAELDSDFGNLSWDEEAPSTARKVDPPERPVPVPDPKAAPEASPRVLTLEEEMERLLGDFDFEVSDRNAR